MDQSTLVSDQVYDSRRFVEKFVADGNPVQAAFWAKQDDEESSYLYVVAELYDREGPLAAARAVQESLRKLGDSSVSSSKIKILGPTNPIAKDLLVILARHTGRRAIRFDDKRLGSMRFEQVYIYPSHVFTLNLANPMTTEEIGIEIFRLMNRGPGIVQPSRITLKDDTTFNGVPFSFSTNSESEGSVSFIAEGEFAPRVVRLDEIASIV